jgi:Domain of unknown function (DUF1939)
VTPAALQFPPLTPERYGAVGDGVTDNTGALTSFIKVVNKTTNPVAMWPWVSVVATGSALTYLTGPLPAITANNFTWNANAALLAKPDSLGRRPLIQVIGIGFKLRGLQINGNQAAFASTQGNLLWIAGNDFLLEDVGVTQSAGNGLVLDTRTASAAAPTLLRGKMSNCHMDNNALQGAILQNVAYIDAINCTFNFNGYGFQKTLATNAFAAFAVAIRLRSHHLTFTGCQALQAGRDGFNVNQGSYAIKFIGCLVWMAGDGGFTIASDDTGSGRPGESETPYDIGYMECESYNNWGSGLAAYQNAVNGNITCNNVSVIGGRWYNNGRSVGNLHPLTVAHSEGIYFGPGSIGINIVKAKCYDDRQVSVITANASGVLTATNWGSTGNWGSQPTVPPLAQANFTPTAANYPKVALYNAARVFQGYGTITAEAAGTVTIATTPFFGVTVASIAAGWFISQRTQFNGCFMDANGNAGCTATVDIDGWGHLPGSPPLSGYTVISNPLGGQNVLNQSTPLNETELLALPSWDSGTGSGTTWTYFLTGGGAAKALTTPGSNLHSPGALQLVAGTQVASGNGTLIANAATYTHDCWFEVSCLVTAVNAGDAQINVFWNNSASVTTVVHPGGGTKLLKVGGCLSKANTDILLQVQSAIGKTNYFDEASIKMKFEPSDNRDFFYPTRNLL